MAKPHTRFPTFFSRLAARTATAAMRVALPFVWAGLLLTGLASSVDGQSARPTGDRRVDDPAGPSAQVPVSQSEMIALIDDQIAATWKAAGVRPSKPATDGEWCRRVYLDVIGRIPTVDELTAFLTDRSSDRRGELVERLLESETYLEEYGRNWSTIWTNLLIGRGGGRDRRSLVNRDGLEQYLRLSFLENKPYDRLVTELVSENGCNTPGEAGYKGAVNFLLDTLDDPLAIQATAKTSRLFLGVQVQCTQCHNHPFNEWRQSQFWGLNAFFRQTRPLRTLQGRDIVSVRLEDQDFAGEGGDPKSAEIYFELRDQTLVAVAAPTFLDGTTIDSSGYVDDVNRRDELARLIVASPDLSRAIVNRMWGHLFGYGFTKPVDDMGPHNPPSHPELLDRLSREFAAQGHDLKRLIRWIVLSEPYSLSSRQGSKNQQDDPQAGSLPLFSRFYLRQMRAEELYESLLTASGAKHTLGEAESQRVKSAWLAQFTITFGTDENDEASTFNGTIPQALMMMNGDLVRRATSVERGSFLEQVASSDLEDDDKVRQLYLAALARRPNGRELRMAGELNQARGGDLEATLQDVWWALLNSNEFILNH